MEMWRETVEREAFLANEVGADFREHNNIYYEIINGLCVLKFGPEVTRIIDFYAYEMVNPDGSLNTLKDEEGRAVKLDNADDLWELIQKINSTIANSKKDKDK